MEDYSKLIEVILRDLWKVVVNLPTIAKWAVPLFFVLIYIVYSMISRKLKDLEAERNRSATATPAGKLQHRFRLSQKVLSWIMLRYGSFFAAGFLLWAILELPHHPSISTNIIVEGAGFTSINDVQAFMIEVLDRFALGFLGYHLIKLIGQAMMWRWPLARPDGNTSPEQRPNPTNSGPNPTPPPEPEGIASTAVHLSPEAMQWILDQIDKITAQIKEDLANFSKSLDELKAAIRQRSSSRDANAPNPQGRTNVQRPRFA